MSAILKMTLVCGSRISYNTLQSHLVHTANKNTSLCEKVEFSQIWGHPGFSHFLTNLIPG